MRPFTLGVLFALTAIGAGCGGRASGPSPTPVVLSPVVRSISVSPVGVGLESATEFTFSADTDGGPQTSYTWNFGDGSSVVGGSSTPHTYSRSGTFTVQVIATNLAGQDAQSTSTRVASLKGRWLGTITGHPGVPRRWRPITSFELRLDSGLPGPDGGAAEINASWADNAGCRVTRGLFGSVQPAREVQVGVEQLLCNDGDFYLRGTADEQVSVITGTCPSGGPNCQFRMVRQ